MRRRKRLIDLTMDDINVDRCAQALISDADSLRRFAAHQLLSQHISSVYGASVSEVLFDLMTSETRLERVDLLMNLGTQLNAVDFGVQ